MRDQETLGAAGAPMVDELLMHPELRARQVEVVAGEILFEPTTPAAHVYFVNSGQVRDYQPGRDQSARLLEILGPGDWFGVAALAGSETYRTRAVAASSAMLTRIAASEWVKLLSRDPDLATAWIAGLARKLVASREDAACLVFDDCNQRLVTALLHFSRSAAASPHPDGVVLRITHQQLAQAVGAARETISLALTQLRQRNLLKTGRNQLFFDPDALRKIARRNEMTPRGEPVVA